MTFLRFVAPVFLCSLSLAAAGCSRASVEHTEASVDALAQAVLEAIERRDMDRLEALALNEAEFLEVVWPELPAARPERNLPADFVWNDLRMKSNYSLGQTLNRYAAMSPLTLVDVRFDRETTPYDTYLVHREAVLIVKGRDGIEQELRLFGSVFEQDGRYKVFSYSVD
ncbi:MAG: hypothetical protein AB7F99_05575 [Vicinamibacterales bacterium]